MNNRNTFWIFRYFYFKTCSTLPQVHVVFSIADGKFNVIYSVLNITYILIELNITVYEHYLGSYRIFRDILQGKVKGVPVTAATILKCTIYFMSFFFCIIHAISHKAGNSWQVICSDRLSDHWFYSVSFPSVRLHNRCLSFL